MSRKEQEDEQDELKGRGCRERGSKAETDRTKESEGKAREGGKGGGGVMVNEKKDK